jgi:alpha-ketoglutarate-dependent taurine dioxygenase
MDIAVTPLHPLFAARIAGADLSQPVSEALARAIERAMNEYAVCVLPDQQLDDERQIAFARLYGPLEVSPPVQNKSGGIGFNARVKHREIFDVSNLDERGAILDQHDARSTYRLGNQLWHTDSSFRQKSAAWSMLHARVIPPAGGDTEFADTLALARNVRRLRADRGRAPTAPAGAASAGAPTSGLGTACALHRVACLAHRQLAGRGRAGAAARIDRIRDAAALRLSPPVAARRHGDLGQPLHHAPGYAVRGDRPCA